MSALKPFVVVDYIKRDFETHLQELIVYWLQVKSNQTAYVDEFKKLCSGVPICAIKLTGNLFSNANEVCADISKLLVAGKDEISCIPEDCIVQYSKIVVVIISRTELKIPNLSSPATLPDFIPIIGGQERYFSISELDPLVDVPIDSEEAKVDDICRLLYELETILINRLDATYKNDHRDTNSFFDLILGDDEKPKEFIEMIKSVNGSVASPSGFRPSVRDKSSFIGRIVSQYNKTAFDELNKLSKKTAKAFGLKADDFQFFKEPLPVVIFRPVNRESCPSERLARGLIINIFTAYQYITSSHHSTDYDRYPVLLLKSFSYDIRRSLDAFIARF